MLWRSATQVPGHVLRVVIVHLVTNIFWHQIFHLVFSARISLLRPTLSIVVAWTIVKAQGSLWHDRNDGIWKWKLPWSNYPHFSTCIVLEQKCLLSLVGHLGHYNMYLTFTHSNSTQPTLSCREDVWHEKLYSSHNERLHYGKMTAVFVKCIRTGCYTHLTDLITLGIRNLNVIWPDCACHMMSHDLKSPEFLFLNSQWHTITSISPIPMQAHSTWERAGVWGWTPTGDYLPCEGVAGGGRERN